MVKGSFFGGGRSIVVNGHPVGISFSTGHFHRYQQAGFVILVFKAIAAIVILDLGEIAMLIIAALCFLGFVTGIFLLYPILKTQRFRKLSPVIIDVLPDTLFPTATLIIDGSSECTSAGSIIEIMGNRAVGL